MQDKRNTTVYAMNTSFAEIQAAVAKLTRKGLETMHAIGAGHTSFFDNGIVEDSGIWGDNLTGELGHLSSGVINQIAKLGLLESHDHGSDEASNWWTLTALGADVANYLCENIEGHNDADEDESVPATTVPVVTTKVGAKWTYIYVDGSLVAEVRNDAAAVVIATLS